MKVSSFFFLTLVLLAFAGIQGWVLVQKFVAPQVFTAAEATVEGVRMEVRAPYGGVIRTIGVQEDERVEQGRELFTIARQVPDPLTAELQEELLAVTAVRPGVLTDIKAVEGAFVQSDQLMATLVDTSADALYVNATLSVDPANVPKIQRDLPATVRANFMNGGKAVPAVVSAIDPTYDADEETLVVRLHLTAVPDELTRIPAGVPVHAEVVLEREPPDNPIFAFLAKIFPVSSAHQEQ